MTSLYDDHVWLTVDGKAWAIRRVFRRADGTVEALGMWRGYHPHLQFQIVLIGDAPDWELYCNRAELLLKQQTGETDG